MIYWQIDQIIFAKVYRQSNDFNHNAIAKKPFTFKNTLLHHSFWPNEILKKFQHKYLPALDQSTLLHSEKRHL